MKKRTTGRTLMYDVASLVIHQGRATVDDIAPSFPAMTVYQLRKALHNAVAKGLIKCLHNGQQAGVRGCGPGVYGPRDAERMNTAPARLGGGVAATSVFDMGGVRIPEAHGTRHSPLGGWL